MAFRVRVECDDNVVRPLTVLAEYASAGQAETELRSCTFRPPGVDVDFPPGMVAAYVYADEGWHWELQFDRPADAVSGTLRKFPPGPGAWWFELHGIVPDMNAGSGIRIGIIDEALPEQAPGALLAHVFNLGGVAWDPKSRRVFEPMDRSGHGTAVTALIACRPNRSQEVMGVAPAAEVLFASAGSDDGSRLDSARLAETIDALVEDYQCDIISCSAGDSPEELPAIRASLDAAREAGVLCFFAAGNMCGRPGFPARYDSCLAVGALGLHSAAPADSFEGQSARNIPAMNGRFYWPDSARGPEVNFAAAGVSVLVPDSSGKSWHSRSGTSFAAPIMAGLAARLLAADTTYRSLKGRPERGVHALELLERMGSNDFRDFCRAGLVKGCRT